MNINKKLAYALGIAATAGTAAAASAYFSTKLLVKTALDREQPKIMKKAGSLIAGGKKDDSVKEMCIAASEQLASEEHEKITITARDGVTLKGHFFPCENAERVIIAFHGWRSSWSYDFGLVTDFWRENRCSVLYAEQRGQNESGGEYIGFGLTERFDCADWANWAVCRCGSQIPIYLTGISMGASTVLMAADLPFPENVRGIMADCGFTSPKAIWKHIANDNLHISYGLRSVIADMMCKKKINMRSDEHSTVTALQNTSLPVLFIHGSEDHFVPVEMTYENYLACRSEKRLLIVPGAEHGISYLVDKETYEAAERNFWRDFD